CHAPSSHGEVLRAGCRHCPITCAVVLRWHLAVCSAAREQELEEDFLLPERGAPEPLPGCLPSTVALASEFPRVAMLRPPPLAALPWQLEGAVLRRQPRQRRVHPGAGRPDRWRGRAVRAWPVGARAGQESAPAHQRVPHWKQAHDHVAPERVPGGAGPGQAGRVARVAGRLHLRPAAPGAPGAGGLLVLGPGALPGAALRQRPHGLGLPRAHPHRGHFPGRRPGTAERGGPQGARRPPGGPRGRGWWGL
ncbi:unnamed protein product, partial [Prorocentrum cordatum]